MPFQANGSLIVQKNGPVASAIIGQNFTGAGYFHGRPSATSAADPADATKTVDAPYNAANSSGSNLGPTSQKLVDRVKTDMEAARAAGLSGPAPADALTTSASGLDPHISPAFALLQAADVAKERKLPEDRVRQLVQENVEGRLLGILGEPRVNPPAISTNVPTPMRCWRWRAGTSAASCGCFWARRPASARPTPCCRARAG
jgi:K+-transporting ATPase ATPase C chain